MSDSAGEGLHRWPAFPKSPRSAGFPVFGEVAQPAPAQAQETPEHEHETLHPAAQAAREQGYAEGLESGRQAAEVERSAQLTALATKLQQATEELQQWVESMEADYGQRCQQVLEAIVGSQLAVNDAFFTDLLREAAQDLNARSDSLCLLVASDLGAAASAATGATVDPGLPPGEIRIVSGPRVGQLRLGELVQQHLAEVTAAASAASPAERDAGNPHDGPVDDA